jgi:hypothetical protein
LPPWRRVLIRWLLSAFATTLWLRDAKPLGERPPIASDTDLWLHKGGAASSRHTCLSEVYYEVRDNSEGDVRHELELLSWTRDLLT